MCECGRYTRLDPFNHEVNYYDEEKTGIDYDKLLKITPEQFKKFPLLEIRIVYWETPMGKPKSMTTKIRMNFEVNDLAEKKGWYAWNAFNKSGNQIVTGLKKGV